jgi:hypothetical protein
MSNFWNAEVERARLRDPVVRAESELPMIVARDSHRWGATIILSGRTTIMMAGGEESKAA